MKDYWKEGKYVDLWTINHILSGFLVAGWGSFLGFSLPTLFIIATVLFVGWEIIERYFTVEHLPNQIMDVVFDYLGFGIFFLVVYAIPEGSYAVLICSTVLFVVLEVTGFRAYRQRNYRSYFIKP